MDCRCRSRVAKWEDSKKAQKLLKSFLGRERPLGKPQEYENQNQNQVFGVGVGNRWRQAE